MSMSEKELAANVEELCKYLHLRYYHTWNSRHSAPGFPDYVIVLRHRVIFRELKTDTGKLTTAQQDWLDDLDMAGQDAAVWRPSRDWPEQITRELRGH